MFLSLFPASPQTDKDTVKRQTRSSLFPLHFCLFLTVVACSVLTGVEGQRKTFARSTRHEESTSWSKCNTAFLYSRVQVKISQVSRFACRIFHYFCEENTRCIDTTFCCNKTTWPMQLERGKSLIKRLSLAQMYFYKLLEQLQRQRKPNNRTVCKETVEGEYRTMSLSLHMSKIWNYFDCYLFLNAWLEMSWYDWQAVKFPSVEQDSSFAPTEASVEFLPIWTAIYNKAHLAVLSSDPHGIHQLQAEVVEGGNCT